MVDLTALADAGAFVSREHQEHLAGAFSLTGLRVDPEAGRVVFGAAGDETAWRAHFLGSTAPDEGTWLWSWENVNGFPDPFVRQSRRLRAFGEQHGVPALAEAELPLTDDLPSRLLRAAKTLTGLTAHVSAPTGAGEGRAWLLLDDPALALPPATVARTVGVLMGGLAGEAVADHRRALTAWADQRGAALEPVAGGVLRVHVSDGTVRVRFDGEDRIAGISTGAGPERGTGSAAPAEAAAPGDAGASDAADPVAPEPLAAVSSADAGDEPAGGSAGPPRRGWLARLLGR